jgi:hypothetical protein
MDIFIHICMYAVTVHSVADEINTIEDCIRNIYSENVNRRKKEK